jgi:hypothetical protein
MEKLLISVLIFLLLYAGARALGRKGIVPKEQSQSVANYGAFGAAILVVVFLALVFGLIK